MLFYHIKTGTLLHNTEFWGTGYSGAGKTYIEGRNNANMCAVPNKGPIPIGEYKIGLSYNHSGPEYKEQLGPCVMNLTPVPGTNTFGRSAFRIHGDNARNDASHGCIILGPAIRKQIANSGEEFITVTES